MVDRWVYVSVVVPVSRPILRAPAVGEVVEDAEHGRLVIVVDPGGDRQGACRATVGDDGQSLADQFADDRVVVGGVDDDRAVERDVGPHVVAGRRREDDEGVAAGERGGRGGARHLGEVREFGEGERFIPVRRHGQADESGLAGAERAGGGRGPVAQSVGDLAHMAPGGIRESALAVEGVGDGSDGYSGGGGHVPDTRPARPTAST